jgi:hypothetical protein
MSIYITKLEEGKVADVVARLRFSESDESKSNKSIRVHISDEAGDLHPLVVKTPWLRAFVGVSSYDGTARSGKKYTTYKLPVNFHQLDTDPAQRLFEEFCAQVDARVLEEATRHADAWLQTPGDAAVVQASYHPTVAYSKDARGQRTDRYPPKLQMKLPSFKGDDGQDRFSTRAFVDSGTDTLQNLDKDVQRGAQVKSLIECTGIWVMNKRFGASWRALQMRVKNPVRRATTYAFQEDSDSE